MGKDSSEILGRVSNLGHGDSSSDIYDDWSMYYDGHLLDEFGYISPGVAATALAGETDRRDIDVIDYGCGTGLVGLALRGQGFTRVDGIDISAGMLEQAEQKQAYRHLVQGDLTTAISLQDESYAAGLCVGSMGAGHVGPQHVPELLRPLERGAPFVVVINGMHYAPEGFDLAFRQMAEDGLWQIHRLEEFNYMTRLNRPGWLLVASKT